MSGLPAQQRGIFAIADDRDEKFTQRAECEVPHGRGRAAVMESPELNVTAQETECAAEASR
jgi:hypothetical protein